MIVYPTISLLYVFNARQITNNWERFRQKSKHFFNSSAVLALLTGLAVEVFEESDVLTVLAVEEI